ncbi:MAG: heparinase [Alphaproteobacteria bacterium]|nr:MAG: heparinase [Alphaproteobacteria bacterium]
MRADLREEADTPQRCPVEDGTRPPDAPAVTIEGKLVRARPAGAGARLATAVARRLRRMGYRSLFYGLRLRGSFPLKLLASPDDPWPGDAARGTDIALGRWVWGGYGVKGAVPAFDDITAPEPYRAWLHSFRWLRDLAALHDNRRAIAIAEPAVRAWLDRYGAYDGFAWRSDLTGERLIHWATYAPMILSGHDLVYRSKVLNGLARQARHLARSTPRALDGMPRLNAVIGLIYSGLLLPGGEDRLALGKTLLDTALGELVLADGGFATRDPSDVHEALRLLIALRGVFRQRQAEAPACLQLAIDRMVPMLKGLLLPDGALASFNGARAGNPRDFALTLDLAECDAKAIENAAHTGYQRLARGKSVVMVDTGPPPAAHLSAKAHAGPLAFEMAVDGQRLVVNCGGCCEDDGVAREIAWMVRATAAHSTLTINDTNAAQIRADHRVGRGPEQVGWTRREAAGSLWLDAVHDGYARRFGVLHRRRLFLAADGQELRGEDNVLAAPRRLALPGWREHASRFDLRFHLHPDVEATPTRDGHAAILRLPGKRGWMFRVGAPALTIEDSLFLEAGGRQRKNRQLVVSGPIDALPLTVNWSLKATTQ